MPINELTPVNEWPTRKLPQDRFDDAVKKAMDQMSVMVDELNSAFIPQTNESVKVINKIYPNINTILDTPNQAAAAAASAQSAASSETEAASSKTAAAQSALEAAASKEAAASSASSASASKTAAAQSATEAADSASSAASSKTAAAQSATGAAASKNAAASSASSASASKTAAAQSATEAADSASSAASSKTAAEQSAATASSEADRAAGEADRAKNEADRAASIVAVDVASDTKAGIVKTDAKTLFVTDPSGTLTAEDVAIGGVLTDTARGRGQIGACYSIPTSGVDFNTLTKAGRYWFTNRVLANCTNKPPTNTGGFCDVLGDEGRNKYTKQIYHAYNDPTIYIRELSSSEGSKSWTKIITEKSIATTSEAGLVKPDGVTLKLKDGAGKVAVEDVLFNGAISMVDSGLLGKAKHISANMSFNLDTDDFDLIVINASSENSSGTYPPFPGFVYVRQYYFYRTSPTNIGNRMQVAFAYNANRMWRRYRLNGSWSSWVKVVDETDLATTTTPGIVKVGKGLKTTGDGTLSYAGMGAATLSVGKNTRLTSSSARNFVLTATGASPNVFLPDPSSLYAGEQFTFFAEGENILVRDFKGQTVGPVLARGKAYLFTLINKTTGEWARAEFSASGTSGDGGSLGLQPSISAPVIFSNVAEAYSTDIELETGRVLHFGAPSTSTAGEFNSGTLSLVSVTGWGAVSVKNTSLTLPQNFILHDLFKLSSSLCCVLAKDTTTNKKFAVIPVDVSGATAVVGTANILTTTGTLGKFIFSRVDDNHALLVYGDGTSLYARLYSFSGSTITAAAPVLVREASSDDIDKLNVQRMDDTRWLLWTGGFVLQLLEVSGTAVTVGEPVTFTPDASWTRSSFSAVSPAPGGDVLIYFSYTYKTGAITTKTAYTLLVYTSSGLVLTKGNMTELSKEYSAPMFLNIDGHMFLWYYRGSGSYSYYLVPVTVDNGTATVGAECLIFTTSGTFSNNLTLLTYTGDTYAIMSVYKNRDDERIYFLRGGFKIATDGSLTESDPPGPATSISNITWGRNPCIQAFPGGRYVYSAGYTRNQNNSNGSTTTVGYTTVSVLNSSFTSLCEARVDDFVSKPYAGSYITISSPYLYPSVFPTGEYQVLVILNQYDSRKPAWAMFTI